MMKRLLFIALLLAILLVAGIAFKLHEQALALQAPAGGSGVFEGTDIDIAAQISARIIAVPVKKGDSVTQGQLLAQLDCSDVEAAINDAKARVAVAIAQVDLAKANKRAAKATTSVIQGQASAAQKQTDALKERQAMAERDAYRLEGAGEGVTQAALDRSQSEARALELDRLAASSSAKATKAQVGVTVAQDTAATETQRAAEANVLSAQANLERALLLRRECNLYAPRAGVVEEVYLDPGEVAPRAAPLLRIVDLNEIKIDFYLPNAELSAVKLGAPVEVIADAYPNNTFQGKITSIVMEAAFTPRNIQTRTDRDRLVYPVEVTLANADHRLRPGMPADVKLAHHR